MGRKGKGVKSPFDLCLTIRGMEQGYILIPMDAFYESIKFPDPHQSSSINTGSVPSFPLS